MTQWDALLFAIVSTRITNTRFDLKETAKKQSSDVEEKEIVVLSIFQGNRLIKIVKHLHFCMLQQNVGVEKVCTISNAGDHIIISQFHSPYLFSLEMGK